MIQRVQTVWLLLSLVCCGLIFYFPFWEAKPGSVLGGMDSIGTRSYPYLLGVFIFLLLSNAITIFLFKKRKLQMRWCNVNIILFFVFLLCGLIGMFVEGDIQYLSITDFKPGAWLTLPGIFFNIMARRGIKKDEDLVRSMDRLR